MGDDIKEIIEDFDIRMFYKKLLSNLREDIEAKNYLYEGSFDFDKENHLLRELPFLEPRIQIKRMEKWGEYSYKTTLYLNGLRPNVKIEIGCGDVMLKVAKKVFGTQFDSEDNSINIDYLELNYNFKKTAERESFIQEADDLDLSEAAQKSLSEVRSAIQNSEYSSAIDRAHTACVGILEAIAGRLSITSTGEINNNKLDGLITAIKKKLADIGSVDSSVRGLLDQFKKIMKTLNDNRNRRSLAHNNNQLLAEADAKLNLEIVDAVVGYLITITKDEDLA